MDRRGRRKTDRRGRRKMDRRGRRSLRCKIQFLHGLFQPSNGSAIRNTEKIFGNTDLMIISFVTAKIMKSICAIFTKTPFVGITMNCTRNAKTKSTKKSNKYLDVKMRKIKVEKPRFSSFFMFFVLQNQIGSERLGDAIWRWRIHIKVLPNFSSISGR